MKWLRNLFKRPTAKPVASIAQPMPAKPAAPAPTAAPRAGDPPAVWVEAICATADKQQALAWLEQLADEVAIAEVAMRARGGETRFAGVRRITDAALLERVAQVSRDKDKRVYRHCADVLKQRRQAEESARSAREISDELRRLLAAAPLSNTRLQELKLALDSLADAGEACQALLQQALTQLHAESEAQRDLHLQQKAGAALAAECRHAEWPWSEHLAGWQQRFDQLRQSHAGLPNWLASQTAARGLGDTLATVETRLAQLVEDQARGAACEQFLTALEAQAAPAAEAAAGWAGLARPEDANWCVALEARWQTIKFTLQDATPPDVTSPLAEVESALEVVSEAVPESELGAQTVMEAATPAKPARRPQQTIDQTALRNLLDQLEQAIEAGHLVDADAAAKRIKTALAGNSLHGAPQSRLQELLAQLETLRGWARWGTTQAREKLIDDARELLNGEHAVEALTVAIQALREQWKRLNAHAAAPKAQWESFDALLEQAYLPVAAHRAEQAVRQAEARGAREALCSEWETELAAIDWTRADFKQIEARRTEIIKLWHAAPQVGFRDERLLRKRFDGLIGGIDGQLDAARAAEFERREQLIAAAQALQAQPDLRLAMQQAKTLQQQWSKQGTSVRLKRGDDQKQWQRFRAACNPVFEKLDAQRSEQDAQRQAQQQERQAMLEAFEVSLAASKDAADADALKRALTQFRAAWGAGRTGSRDADDALETRARDLQRQARQRLDRLRQEKHRQRFALLAQKAALAQRVEAAALSGIRLEAVLAEAQQAWAGLPPLPARSEALLGKRFTAATQATEAALTAGRRSRADLLLELEISLGLPSPEQFAAARRERQLGRLQDRFGAAVEVAAEEPEALLVRCYATPASPDAADEQRLAAAAKKLAALADEGVAAQAAEVA